MSENIFDLAPMYYRSIRRKIPIRKILGLKPRDDYWRNRSELYYYKVIKNWVEDLSPGNLIIDVGAWNTPVVTWGSFKRRVSIDLHEHPRYDSKIEEVVADWLDYQHDEIADVILCLQVLEHLTDGLVKPFAEKIVRSGRFAVISVPYMWEKGQCTYHLQDPVDLKKLEGWVGYPAIKHIVEDRDKDKRLIALFEGCGEY